MVSKFPTFFFNNDEFEKLPITEPDMEISFSKLQSFMPSSKEIELMAKSSLLSNFVNNFQKQYSILDSYTNLKHKDCNVNNNSSDTKVVTAGKCGGTRGFWCGDTYIPRARLVTEATSEDPIGFCFPDVANNNALARLKSAKLIPGVDYITVNKLVPKYNTTRSALVSAGQTCESIVTRSGINKLLQLSKYKESLDYTEFLGILQDTLEWIDSIGVKHPKGFTFPWKCIDLSEKVDAEIKICERKLRLESESKFAKQEETTKQEIINIADCTNNTNSPSLAKRKFIPQTPFNSPTKIQKLNDDKDD